LNKAVGIHENNLDCEGLNICRPAVIKYGVLFTTTEFGHFIQRFSVGSENERRCLSWCHYL